MSLLTALKSIFGFGPANGAIKKTSAGDRVLVCLDCSEQFIFDAGEQAFFKSKGFTDPKRCPNCRRKIKSQLKKKRRGSRNQGGGGPRRFTRRPHSLIDGDSPYADER